MERKIRIYKSFEEQEKDHLKMMASTTVEQRLIMLFKMQQITKAFHPQEKGPRKIIIHKNGHPK